MSRPVDYFCSESLRKNLKGKTVRGALITGSSQAISILIGLVAVPVLTRLLVPEDFGLVAMVAVFTNFAAMFVDSGMSQATVQREEISRQQVTNLFWLATSLGCTIAIIVASLATSVSWFYSEPRLTSITIALAISYIVTGLTIQHQALLTRAMQFHTLAVATISGQIVGHIAGIAWAFWRHQQANAYWALVLIPIVTAIVRMLVIWIACDWRPGIPRRNANTRGMLTFGANIMGFNFINYFSRNADNMLIGWWWGATTLGFYERAYRLVLLPPRQISPPLTSIVVPALSRLRTDPEKYRKAYLIAVRSLAWVSILLVGFLFCASDPLVLLYFGKEWGPVAPLLRSLIPAAWATSFITSAGWVYRSWGHVDRHLKWGAVHSAILVAVMLSCVPFGAQAVAIGISIAYVVLRLPGFMVCFAGTPLQLVDLRDAVWRPTLITLPASGVAYFVATWQNASDPNQSLGALGISLGLTTVCYTVCVAILTVLTPGALGDLASLRTLLKSSRPESPA